MKSNYKKLGQYIKQVKLKNKGLITTDLKGINIEKNFMPSVANTTGTDLSKYRVVSKYQFAFNPMHVGRDEVLPISMLNSEGNIIVSPAYIVFEVKDHEVLNPEYLMMWFRRKEFDRNAWFTTDNSVRGGFNWEDFCEMTLPVPSIEKQREIVAEYNAVVERVKLNEQMNEKLEQTAQAIFKQWFVDFEFPISKEYALSINKPELEGKPYKSSGGEMVYNEELDKGIPKNWAMEEINYFGNIITGKTPSINNPEDFGTDIPFVTPTDYKNFGKFVTSTDRGVSSLFTNKQKGKLLKSNSILVTCIGSNMGKTVINKTECVTNQQINAISLYETKHTEYIFYTMIRMHDELRRLATGSSTMLMLNKSEFEKIKILKPNLKIAGIFQNNIDKLNLSIWKNANLNNILKEISKTILSKMATIED